MPAGVSFWRGCPVLAPLGRGSSRFGHEHRFIRRTLLKTLYRVPMPWGLKRFQQSKQLHFLTFSCYRRKPKLGEARGRAIFEAALERTRTQYQFDVSGYVVMPEHVHLLVSEPEVATLARALQSLKQSVSRTLGLRAEEPFWQERYYDFNVYSREKYFEKLRYM